MLNAVSGWAVQKSWPDFAALVGILMVAAAATIQYVDQRMSTQARKRIESIRDHIDNIRDTKEELQHDTPLGPGHPIKGVEIDEIYKLTIDAAFSANRKNKGILRKLTDDMDAAERKRNRYDILSVLFLVVGAILSGFPIVF
jgi:hypothetical protein